jgi:hypothetical protein
VAHGAHGHAGVGRQLADGQHVGRVRIEVIVPSAQASLRWYVRNASA